MSAPSKPSARVSYKLEEVAAVVDAAATAHSFARFILDLVKQGDLRTLKAVADRAEVEFAGTEALPDGAVKATFTGWPLQHLASTAAQVLTRPEKDRVEGESPYYNHFSARMHHDGETFVLTVQRSSGQTPAEQIATAKLEEQKRWFEALDKRADELHEETEWVQAGALRAFAERMRSEG